MHVAKKMPPPALAGRFEQLVEMTPQAIRDDAQYQKTLDMIDRSSILICISSPSKKTPSAAGSPQQQLGV